MAIIHERTYSRAGLLGNPSDGFGGKTISFLIKNFHAAVRLWESPELEIRPNHQDRLAFAGLDGLLHDMTTSGYYGGIRLIKAAIKVFADQCLERGIELEDRNFTVSYETNIPRQVGLAGSSAIIVSAFNALMRFYGVEFPKPILPEIILSVERDELLINAGLQDRVIQVYGGLAYMDFAPGLMAKQGHGDYRPMDTGLLPPLFLAYNDRAEESGKMHSDVRFRFDRGDPEVKAAMVEFAEFAEQGRSALESGDLDTLGRLMDRNFDLRRKIYGDKVIGKQNLRMIEIARKHGSPAKFSGSGGAVIGISPPSEGKFEAMLQNFRADGFSICKVMA